MQRRGNEGHGINDIPDDDMAMKMPPKNRHVAVAQPRIVRRANIRKTGS
jgi:hypothetical protein